MEHDKKQTFDELRVKHSAKFLKQRKFFTVLPLLALPFLTAIFAALGGGKGSGAQSKASETAAGLNLKLPDAHFKKGKEMDKMGLYEEAGKDSDRIKAAIKKDPYYILENHDEDTETENNTGELQSILQHSAIQHNQPELAPGKKLNISLAHTGIDSNEGKIIQKLAQLKVALKMNSESVPQDFSSINRGVNPDLEKLQRLMNAMKQGKLNESDPELVQINGMLDKITNIQHPEKLQDSMKSLALKNKPQSFAVRLTGDEKTNTANQNGFYEITEDTSNEATRSNAIEAVIEETQTLVSGAVVKLRLLQDVYVNGSRIAKDQWVYGAASLSNERLKIVITTIRSNDNILPVALDVYDMDGLQGIYIPGSINRDVSKQSADDAISTIGLTNFDPSLGAQAASAGIQAAKTLMSKKIKLVRVTVKAGYKVLLKDNSQK